MRNVLEEARMVPPGIQALFGFQTVAVFNQRFKELASGVQTTHTIALLSVVVAIALVMMPAAWYRIVEPHQVSCQTVSVASGLICAALLPLAFGVALDIYVMVAAVTDSYALSMVCAAATLVLLLVLWFAIPMLRRAVYRAAGR
ncbi:hypothetical protein GTP69_00165 [Duganella sp. CY42W]|uniref:Uncharacterized protein n=1 Tax=Duganella levis TaxID=2692169 RepID=A0ABW9VT70_9BURK|nr:hypothetical protein [Duganella levis]